MSIMMKTIITIDFTTNTTKKIGNAMDSKNRGAGTTIGVCNAVEFKYF